MTYQFKPEEEWKLPPMEIPEKGLIVDAFEKIEQVQPEGPIKIVWEGQIYKDIETGRPSDWRAFLRSLIP